MQHSTELKLSVSSLHCFPIYLLPFCYPYILTTGLGEATSSWSGRSWWSKVRLVLVELNQSKLTHMLNSAHCCIKLEYAVGCKL